MRPAPFRPIQRRALGSVLICFLGLAFCLVAFFAVNKVSANPYYPASGSNVHAAIASPSLLLKGISVPNLTVAIDCPRAVAQPFDFLRRQRSWQPQSLHFWNSRPQNIPVRMIGLGHQRQLCCERILAYVYRCPMNEVIGWSLPRVLDRNLRCRTSLRIDDSRNSLGIVFAIVDRVRNIGNNSSLNGHIGPQLAFRTPAHREDCKQRQNAAYDAQTGQNPIGEVCRSDSSFQILFGMRLIISVSLCIFSIFLAYFGYARRWCVWLGLIGMGLGLLLLLAPLHWEWFLCASQDSYQQTEHHKTFTHNTIIVPQKPIDTI